MRYGTWETTVYGKTFEEIQRAAEQQAGAFGVGTDQLMYSVEPHTYSRTVDGKQRVVEHEARVVKEIKD